MDSTELAMPQVMERYCRPREVDSHPAIKIKHLITNLLLMNGPELPKLQQLGTHSVLMGPMKAILGQPPTSITLPDRFQGDEYALGPSGSLPWDLPSEGLYLQISTYSFKQSY